MLPRPTTPARVFARLEVRAGAAMKAKHDAGDIAGAEAARRSIKGWTRLRSMAARDEPRGAWRN